MGPKFSIWHNTNVGWSRQGGPGDYRKESRFGRKYIKRYFYVFQIISNVGIYLFSSCCALLISVPCRKLWENFSHYLFKYYFSAITFFSLLLHLLLEECWSLLVSFQSLTCLCFFFFFFTILTPHVAFSLGPQAIFSFVSFPFFSFIDFLF